MSNTPNNPLDPNASEKGPWLYSGASQPTPIYVPPTTASQPASSTPPPASAEASPPPPPPSPAPPAKPAGLPNATFGSFSSKPSAPKADDASLAGIVDTIEAIIVALILALTFRAFIVEAFVIPTGSMAPTLLGAHFNIICPKCGYVFTRDASLRYQLMNTKDGPVIPYVGNRAELTSNRIIPADGEEVGPLICPNCQYQIPYQALPQYLGSTTAQDYRPDMAGQPRSVPFAWANNGDRILVMKYLYNFLPPKRFDVIVFKEPMYGRDNFIKRLIGLPGETIEVINGDVFIGPPGKTSAVDRVIARKPAYIQSSVWQLVYDNDYYPIDQNVPRSDGTTWTNPWEGAGDTSAQWTINSPVLHYAADAPGMIQFNARVPYTFNTLGYNNDINDLTAKGGVNLSRCGDLHLETVWTPSGKEHESISLTVGQPHNEYRATWSDGQVQLDKYNTTTRLFEKTLAVAAAGPAGTKSHHLVLDNVDRTVRVFIDGDCVIDHATPWNAAEATAEAETIADDPVYSVPELRINISGPCTLAHLKVCRDLYYTQSPSSHVRTANEGNPLTLGPDEFFAMGDNSRLSDDGRMWNVVYPPLDDLGTRLGIVPRRYLLGKAFFVYWPAGFRPSATDAIPNSLNIPLIPNAGDMRLIR